MRRPPLFRVLWYCSNVLVIVAIGLVLYCAAWEFSTRSYLKGFSDAIVSEAEKAG